MSTSEAQMIAAAMGELLGSDDVAAEQHFFDAGGTSIMAVHLVASLRARGLEDVSLLDVLREPTPVGLAQRLRDRADTAPRPAG